MTVIDAVLAAHAHRAGRAQRSSTYRHRHLNEEPIVLVPWHLGAEPFTYAAFAFGQSPEQFDLVLPGEPRERRLLFPVTLELAVWFNALFEAAWASRISTGDAWLPERATDAPQIWVPNEGAITVLGKLGRRLAYLPTDPRPDGPPPADPALVRFGRNLQFLAAHANQPGQQLVVAATSLAGSNWVTEQTVGERANLMALDAWIDPPDGQHGFEAAIAVEEVSTGPLPPPAKEQEVANMIEAFNIARRAEDPGGMRHALEQQRELYRELSQPAWDVTWRVIEREREWPEEPRFVAQRWQSDIGAYSQHMSWLSGPTEGRRRTRQTVRQAISTRTEAEKVKALVEAEEAISDPLHMIPLLLDHKAVEGEVIGYDTINREVKPGNCRATTVPIVTLRSPRPCLIPVGKELWWTERPDRVRALVRTVSADTTGVGSIVELSIMQNLNDAIALAGLSVPAAFSQMKTGSAWTGKIPTHVPWTHRVPDPPDDGSLEENG